jgi:hypothetical protein
LNNDFSIKQKKKIIFDRKIKEIEKFDSKLLVLIDKNKLVEYHPQIFSKNKLDSLRDFFSQYNDKSID